MHYFPSWTEKFVLWELSYDKFLMYLATIPDHSTDEEDEEEDEAADPRPKTKKKKSGKVTGSVNLFDIATKHK